MSRSEYNSQLAQSQYSSSPYASGPSSHQQSERQQVQQQSQSPTSSPSSSSPPQKKHICPTCGRAFTTSGHLARHSRVHNDERNHKCPFPGCERRYSRQDNLQLHYRTHLFPDPRQSSTHSTIASTSRRTSAMPNGHNEVAMRPTYTSGGKHENGAARYIPNNPSSGFSLSGALHSHASHLGSAPRQGCTPFSPPYSALPSSSTNHNSLDMQLPPVSALHCHSLPISDMNPHFSPSGLSASALVAERRRLRREDYVTVERRRRVNINQTIGELASLIPESMLEEDDGMFPSLFEAVSHVDALSSKRENSDMHANECNNVGDVAREAASTNSGGAKIANKGIILRRSVEYIQYLQELVRAQVAHNRELEAELKVYRAAAGVLSSSYIRSAGVHDLDLVSVTGGPLSVFPSHAPFTPHPRPRPDNEDTHTAFPSHLHSSTPVSIVSSPSRSDSDSRPAANITMNPPKRRRMSTDSASEPSSSPASYGSLDNFSNKSSVTSNSVRSLMDHPFSSYSPCNGGNSSPNSQSNKPHNRANPSGMTKAFSHWSDSRSPIATNENYSRPGSAQSGSSGGRSDSP